MWRNGSRKGLKIPWELSREGSSPSMPTIRVNKEMKRLIIFLLPIMLMGCSNMNLPNNNASTPNNVHAPNKLKARITYYNAHEDKFGNRVACSPNKRAKEGITVAAHPVFPFNTEIFIPQLQGILGDGKFLVQDRGSAVTSERASNKMSYVFDIFLDKTKKATRIFANKMAPYMDVILLKKG